MRKARKMASFRTLVMAALLLSLIPLASVKPVSADPGILIWSIVNTPGSDNTTSIVSPSEVNVIAIGTDGRTFYAVDIPDTNPGYGTGRVYKSTDGGVTWPNELERNLPADAWPVWNLAVAPDDVNFLVAVTDGTGAPIGPQRVFISQDGGAIWQNTNISFVGTEYISCLDISMAYGGTNRDIAIGTRDGLGGGKVFVLQVPSFSNWIDQNLTLSDVVALKFSPTYTSDLALTVVYSNASGTHVNVGIRDINANTTNWTAIYGANPPEVTGGAPLSSPTHLQIVTADLELPSDFSGQNGALRRFYISTDAIGVPQPQSSGVYRVDDTVAYWIKPPTTAPTSGRISSIAYYGTYAEGILLAGEVTAGELAPTPSSYGVYIWRTSNPNQTVGVPTWAHSDARKSPTGGGNSGYANAQVAWSPNGNRAYCGTSSANPTTGGTAWAANRWPRAWLTSVQFDESAFSVSPYSPNYEQLLVAFGKTEDSAVGNIWNQLSLIDTRIDKLTDVAVLETPEAAGEAPVNYDVLYLASINPDVGGFDSIWRSTSDPLGRYWERILCTSTSDNGIILRVKQPSYDESNRSEAVAFADWNTETVGYSNDEGQTWHVQLLRAVTDLALTSDTIMYILSDTWVYRYEWGSNSWVKTSEATTGLSGHTIAVPLKNPTAEGGETEDWVIVGERGSPGGNGRVVYADFSQFIVKFAPFESEALEPPIPGDAHVIADDRFEQNKTIYNATHDSTSLIGGIYRWVIDKSTAWDELASPNNDFYGLGQRNDILYGAWDVPTPGINYPGVDRTLYPRAYVPPPPEWDYLIEGLPVPANANFPASFTLEPSSLKVSSNQYNSLWAIDDRAYNWENSVGCLWAFSDTMAKVGPWTTSPASGDIIPVDPKSGRAVEVNFAWRQLSYSTVYELQLAKDVDFYNRVLVNENITPVNQLAPEVYLPAGALIPVSGSNIGSWANLESGHTYYWRVRARAAVTGEIARSPWSATMYFTVEAGLPTASPYPTVTLFSPMYGAKNISTSPGFSWSGMPRVTKYEFILARDAALQQVIVKVEVPMTSYLYDGKLDYNTGYFWQVRVIEPVVSDPSPIGTFTVIAESKPVTPEAETPSPIPSWVWWIIAVFTALVVVIIAFTMVKPSYIRPGGGKLFKVEPIVDKPKSPIVDKLKNPFVKIWESITMAVRRQRYLRKSSDSEPKDSKSEDSQDKLT